MQNKSSWFFFRMIVRGSLLFLVLIWFVHTRLTEEPLPFTTQKQEDLTFVARLARKANITEQQAKILLQELGAEIAVELDKGNRVQIPGLGVFRAEHFASKYFFSKDGSAKEFKNYKDMSFVPSDDLVHLLNPQEPVIHRISSSPSPAEPTDKSEKFY